jgi:hyperosmotically inducible protein
VTLGGQVASENDKSQAESIAKSLADAQVVADQIAVIPVGAEKEAKVVNSDLDQGIEKNLDAALIQNKLHKSVKYEVKNRVVTLTGARVLLAPGF